MTKTKTARSRGKAGFTLPEVLIAGSLATLVSAAVMTTFLWTGKQSNLCSKISWAQSEVQRTSGRIERFIRNAEGISAIDESGGNWVEVRFKDGTTGRFTYCNSPETNRDGRLYLERNGVSQNIVARGLTKIPSTTGYSIPMFTKINDRAIRVAYRVTALLPNGQLTADDGSYASCARFAVCLRNSRGQP